MRGQNGNRRTNVYGVRFLEMNFPSATGQKVKVVFIGNSCVGKTSLFARFQSHEFVPGQQSTIGAACANVNVTLENGTTVNLIVWDTAGQEQYRGIVPMYVNRCAFILIVYDVTNRESFESVASWIKLSNDKAPETARIVIVGNKCDLEPKRMVQFAEGTRCAQVHNAFLFLETSALNAKGVDSLLMAVAAAADQDHRGIGELVQSQEVLIQRPKSPEENSPCC
jgi:small GTP-binding protein